MTPEELKEIEERCNKATPRPWFVFSDDLIMRAVGARGVFCRKHGLLRDHRLFEPVKATREDEIFVAFAQKDIPDLLAHIKELESRLPRWIPVEERWPEKDGIYLVFDPTIYEIDVLWFVLEMSGLPTSKTKEEWETVSHWQPLPKGPEE